MSPRKHTPDQELSQTESATAVADAPSMLSDVPAREAGEDNPSFAERVGEKTYAPIPDPFGIATDFQAGVRLMESRRDRQMAIMFGEGRAEDKPSQAVLDMVKEAGYRWNPAEKVWTHPLRFDSAMTTRIEAERLYQNVCAQIREEKGIDSGPGKQTPF
jgi:hypothetical protein